MIGTQEIETAESTAIQSFVKPAEEQVSLATVPIRSDVAYGRAGQALRTVREKRKALAGYFKEQPNGDPGPGQGLCFYARKAWDSANSLFNRFDLQFKVWDESLDGSMKKYRAELEEKARAEAEEKARVEHERLEAEAAEQRRLAESERNRLQAIAEAERKKAEAERQKRFKAEMEAVHSKAEQCRIQREAEEARLRIEYEAAEKKRQAEESARQQEEEAKRKEQEAQQVVAVIEREAPKVEGVSVRKTWKAEVLSLQALVRAVADGKAPLTCLEASESGCNKLAVAFGGVNPPAGLRFVQAEVSSTRKRQ